MKRFPIARRPIRKIAGRMNKTEAAYASIILGSLQQLGIVDSFYYEGVKFRLADATFYTPDFMVVLVTGEIELHEVKATWDAEHQDDARVKIKVAAERFPMFRFTSFEMKSQHREWFGPHGAADWDMTKANG